MPHLVVVGMDLKIKACMKKKNKKTVMGTAQSAAEGAASRGDDGLDLTKKIEFVSIAELRPHPRNYRDHPDDQIDHLAQSIKDNGFYRNVVISRDGVILAGHGAVKAALKIGLKQIPVIRLDINSNDERALKVLVGDNEIARLAMMDDRALTELLKELKDWDPTALLGTGFDESMIAALAFVTRPASEIGDKNAAAHWIGMPEYNPEPNRISLVLSFDTEIERESFVESLKLIIAKKYGSTWSAWYPPRDKSDLSSLRFQKDE